MAGTKVDLGYSRNFEAKVEFGEGKDTEKDEIDRQEDCDTTTETKIEEYRGEDGSFTTYSSKEEVDCGDEQPQLENNKQDEYFMDRETESTESIEPESESDWESE